MLDDVGVFKHLSCFPHIWGRWLIFLGWLIATDITDRISMNIQQLIRLGIALLEGDKQNKTLQPIPGTPVISCCYPMQHAFCFEFDVLSLTALAPCLTWCNWQIGGKFVVGQELATVTSAQQIQTQCHRTMTHQHKAHSAARLESFVEAMVLKDGPPKVSRLLWFLQRHTIGWLTCVTEREAGVGSRT